MIYYNLFTKYHSYGQHFFVHFQYNHPSIQSATIVLHFFFVFYSYYRMNGEKMLCRDSYQAVELSYTVFFLRMPLLQGEIRLYHFFRSIPLTCNDIE